jgi:hypothetical protein
VFDSQTLLLVNNVGIHTTEKEWPRHTVVNHDFLPLCQFTAAEIQIV